MFTLVVDSNVAAARQPDISVLGVDRLEKRVRVRLSNLGAFRFSGVPDAHPIHGKVLVDGAPVPVIVRNVKSTSKKVLVVLLLDASQSVREDKHRVKVDSLQSRLAGVDAELSFQLCRFAERMVCSTPPGPAAFWARPVGSITDLYGAIHAAVDRNALPRPDLTVVLSDGWHTGPLDEEKTRVVSRLTEEGTLYYWTPPSEVLVAHHIKQTGGSPNFASGPADLNRAIEDLLVRRHHEYEIDFPIVGMKWGASFHRLDFREDTGGVQTIRSRRLIIR
ncbi:MAG: hypothetical protein RIE53_02635 [Rhodothermales bacterium]